MDPLLQAQSKVRTVAEGTSISIRLSLLMDLVQEITELRDALLVDDKEDDNAKAPALHGRARLRPVGGHEGRSSPAREGVDGPQDAA